MAEKTQGLLCPNCSGVVPVQEGQRIVQCPYCQTKSLVQGERGVRRWQVEREVERVQALTAVTGFFSGITKAGDLKKKAEIKELFLIYLPYWRVQALVTGWLFGRVKKDEDSTKPIEVSVSDTMHWNDAAVDVAEYGVHRVKLRRDQLQPYDSEQLHAEAMVFEPAESRTDAMAEAHGNFTLRARAKRSLTSRFFERFHYLQERFSIVYYPLWVARYEYNKRHYQVVVDGVKGDVLYGKAPGNIWYRAGVLVGGMALGNLILVNGTLLAGYVGAYASEDGEGLAAVLIPIGVGLGLIAYAYNAFRYGEEVEEIDAENKKAASTATGDAELSAGSGLTKMMKMGMQFLDEVTD